jgi:hypothetical protein
MRSWLPPDHLAWQVMGVVRELDLSGFTAAYGRTGRGKRHTSLQKPVRSSRLGPSCAYSARLEGRSQVSGRCLHTAVALSVSMAPLIPLESP